VDGKELKESIFDMDLDSLIPESTCNTRKVRICSILAALFVLILDHYRKRIRGPGATQ
jgi:hypothetical protein